MAHRISIVPVPVTLKSGQPSKSKVEYQVWDKWRNKKELVKTVPNKGAAEEVRHSHREWLKRRHLENHPNDQRHRAFVSAE